MKSARQGHLRSWHRRKQARPIEILDAALTVFSGKGFGAARMEDIAARAGITKGTIYLYFPSKEDVFKSLIRRHIADTLAVAVEQAKTVEDAPVEFLRVFFDCFIESMLIGDMPALFKIMISEAGGLPELSRFWCKEVTDKSIDLLSRAAISGTERGATHVVDRETVARLYVAPALVCLIWRTSFEHLKEVSFDYREFLSLHREALFRELIPDETV